MSKFLLILSIYILFSIVNANEIKSEDVRVKQSFMMHMKKIQNDVYSSFVKNVNNENDDNNSMDGFAGMTVAKVNGFAVGIGFQPPSNTKTAPSSEDSIKPICPSKDATSTVPVVGMGMAMPCYNLNAEARAAAKAAGIVLGSVSMRCSQSSETAVKLKVTIYSGDSCDGSVVTLPAGASPMPDIEMGCGATVDPESTNVPIPMNMQCIDSPIPPPPKYDGIRMAMYPLNNTCMGYIMGYGDAYNVPNNYGFDCENGVVNAVTYDPTSTFKFKNIACTAGTNNPFDSSDSSSSGSSSIGCVTASNVNPAQRTFVSFTMTQIFYGITYNTFMNPANEAKNIMTFIQTLSQIYQIDLSAFKNFVVTAVAPSTNANANVAELAAATPAGISVSYEISVEPGNGNDLTDQDAYDLILKRHEDGISTSCTGTDCFNTLLPTKATANGVTDLNTVTASSTFNGATPPQKGNGYPPATKSTPATTEESNNTGAIVGGVIAALVVAGIAFYQYNYYYKVYLPSVGKEAADAASNGAGKNEVVAPPAPVNPMHGV